jgi:hypothetical protein
MNSLKNISAVRGNPTALKDDKYRKDCGLLLDQLHNRGSTL